MVIFSLLLSCMYMSGLRNPSSVINCMVFHFKLDSVVNCCGIDILVLKLILNAVLMMH